MTAIAAVDTALWDIKGKALNTPVYQLLGGASRDSVMVYGHASGETIEETVEAVAGYVARGYKAVRAQTSVPGFERTYGVSRGDAYEPAERGLAPETRWSSERYLEACRRCSASARQWVRDQPAPASTSITGSRRSKPAGWANARAARPFLAGGPDTCGEPGVLQADSPAHNDATCRRRVFNSIHDCRQLIQEQLIDYIRTTVVCTRADQSPTKIASLAEIYQIRTGSHGARI
jgi:mannonate dehydratase